MRTHLFGAGGPALGVIGQGTWYLDEARRARIKNRYVSYPEVYRKALPDTLVWRQELAFNEPLVETYFRHPSYDDYPVVGVNWLQAGDYCKWRSSRVNEMILIEKGILNPTPDSKDSDNFDTKAYLNGQYQGNVKKNLPNLVNGGERAVMFDDGILLPDYRLPTEAEWEYAALGLQGNQPASEDEVYTDRRIYPWNGNTVRYKKRTATQGRILANFKRGRGDYMGLAGNLNDNASFCGPVRSYLPNDFGLYNMAGNVNEWTADTYRPMTSMTLNDAENQELNPFRGNQFSTLVIDEEGKPVEKDSLGRLKYRSVEDEDAQDRENYFLKIKVMNINNIFSKLFFAICVVFFTLGIAYGQKTQDLSLVSWKARKDALSALEANEANLFQVPENEVYIRTENEYLLQFVKQLKIYLSSNEDVKTAIAKSKDDTREYFHRVKTD